MTIIAVDFDGTIVEHKYPKIGDPVPGAIAALRRFQKAGAKLILWTMRSGDRLAEAVEYCKKAHIEFWAVNENPEQAAWTSSPKCYAHLYIDDAALGCPLIKHPSGESSVVDWKKVTPLVMRMLTGEPDE